MPRNEDGLIEYQISDLERERIAALREAQEIARKHIVERGRAVARLWPAPLDLEALAERDPEPPKFLVGEWLPAGYATLLAGHGGVGKSAIALYLAVCIAAGKEFFGLPVERRRVFYLACEDREQILHWRLRRICAHLGIDLGGLRGWLEVLDLVGRDAVLWDRDPRTGGTFTPAFSELEDRAREHETEVLVVDGISDAFAGNENARSDVKRFVNSAVALIPPDRGAVLLLGHIAKAGTEGYSGSTAWHNSARARWYLYPETAQDDDGGKPARTGTLVLELQKANLSGAEQSMRFRWDPEAHLFAGELVGASQFDRRVQEGEERSGVLRAFRACAEAVPPIVVPAALQGPRTALNLLSARPEFPEALRASKPGARRFRRILEELRQSRAVEKIEYRRTNRHTAAQLQVTTEGMRQCAA